eukprot:TRINITY_DN130_c3_g2_i1.p1 TRINITY_DN130_c3_g2~~TRINITY_DN130_c3_g2_i1.p1  ORF type:complete len:379 (-),score=98.14 TRINITY_DN130_c3_g2_i1:151-1149(-)
MYPKLPSYQRGIENFRRGNHPGDSGHGERGRQTEREAETAMLTDIYRGVHTFLGSYVPNNATANSAAGGASTTGAGGRSGGFGGDGVNGSNGGSGGGGGVAVGVGGQQAPHSFPRHMMPHSPQMLSSVPSPVLTSEQLYQRAQWMDDPLALRPTETLISTSPDTYDVGYPHQLLQYESDTDSDPESVAKSTTSPLPAWTTSEKSGEEEDGQLEPSPFTDIPQSLAEIYQLSNKNRKLKKKSKKLSVVVGPNSPLFLHGVSESGSPLAPAKQDNVDFMRSITWLGANEEPPKPFSAQSEGKSHPTRKNNLHNNDRIRNARGGRGGVKEARKRR